MTTLLSRSNPKLQKCSKYGYLSAGLMLQPKTASGIIDVCRFSTGCADVCLDLSQAVALLSSAASLLTQFKRRVIIELSYSALRALSLSTN
jgi:hypothetical protein